MSDIIEQLGKKYIEVKKRKTVSIQTKEIILKQETSLMSTMFHNKHFLKGIGTIMLYLRDNGQSKTHIQYTIKTLLLMNGILLT